MRQLINLVICGLISSAKHLIGLNPIWFKESLFKKTLHMKLHTCREENTISKNTMLTEKIALLAAFCVRGSCQKVTKVLFLFSLTLFTAPNSSMMPPV